MSSDNTRINLKHYIGKPFRSEAFAITASILLGLGGAVGVGVNVNNALEEAPDVTGTAQQEAAYQDMLSKINALDLQEAQVDIAQKQHEIGMLDGSLTGDAATESAQHIAEMRRNFELQGYGTLLDLFNHGAQGGEADISEAQFLELGKVFEDKISPVSDFGFKITEGTAAYLDDARTELGNDGKLTGSAINDAQQIQEYMSEAAGNPAGLGFGLGMLTFIGIFFSMLFAGAERLQDWGYEDKRVARRPKKQKGLKH
ncbi:MAG: hypothetical protein EP349_07330 [Alphaproteobacteria bacterium]|nr:MAG: hypothetical protein EP349_07330 [Alphaproteobacteria bacterium]